MLPVRLLLVVTGLVLFGVGVAYAAIPSTRRGPVNTTAPNPGTQQQELSNITFPFPFNVFEFPVTCGACHSGTIDQQVGHYGNWAGSNMASAARDPIFRANAILVNDTVRGLTGTDGAANVCFRCHSPNGWLSGRFDPKLAGNPDGSNMIHSVLASTDDEGVMCETCHRAMGGVEMKDIKGLQQGVNGVTVDAATIKAFTETLALDPAFNLMSGLTDWPHAGNPSLAGPLAGNPLGDATLQFNDGMTYGGKYDGSVDVYFSDVPLQEVNPDGTPKVDVNHKPVYSYTGQTYGIYPPDYSGNKVAPPAGMPRFNSLGQEIVYNADGSVAVHFEVPKNNLTPTQVLSQSLSIEHPTYKNDFIRSSEFCGACHDLTVPVLNHGMPEQRTYTEWKYSSFGTKNQTCQSCHTSTLKHEYADGTSVGLNADPTLVGFAPYGKDRNPNGGTAVHKLAGANRDLPAIMKILYPEVDLEIIGAPTGRDTRLFPGLMSDRSQSYDRTINNTEIQMRDALDVQIVQKVVATDGTISYVPGGAPTYNTATGKWEVQVKVENTSGHRIPTGYPDGRRFWVSLTVTDTTKAPVMVYQSGVYDQANAELKTDAKTAFTRALTNNIDSRSNAVMVYEKVTATCDTGVTTNCEISPNLLNGTVVFDNRIPPAGYSKADYFAAGTKFYSYEPIPGSTTLINQVETPERYADGQNYDIVTYSFDAPPTAQLSARAEVYWQTHTKDFIEHLRTNDTSAVRPEGPPSIYAANYPLVPTYLSDTVSAYLAAKPFNNATSFSALKALDGTPLNDNWGGIAYAGWLLTGMGAPYQVDAADTTPTAAPATTPTLTATTVDAYAIKLDWNRVPDADGYYVWIRYGLDTSTTNGDVGVTASWDRLAVVYPQDATSALTFTNDGLNVGKSYQYRIEAFNSKGSTTSNIALAKTAWDLPLTPADPVKIADVTATSVTLSWVDQADNETHFGIQRQTVLPNGNTTVFTDVAIIASQTITAPNTFGGNSWTDPSVTPNTTYNYRVFARNSAGDSTPTLPVGVTTLVETPVIPAPIGAPVLSLTQNTATSVLLNWTKNTTGQTTFQVNITRTPPANTGQPIVEKWNRSGSSYSYNVGGLIPGWTYTFSVVPFNKTVAGTASEALPFALPTSTPTTPAGLTATWDAASGGIKLNWAASVSGITAGTNNGYTIERSTDGTTWNTLPIGGAAAPATVSGTATSAPATTYTDNAALVANTTHSYRIKAVNTLGVSPVSDPPATALTPPSAPTVNATLVNGRIDLSLSYTGGGDGTITGYTIQRNIGNAGWTTPTTITCTALPAPPATNSTCTDSPLTSNTTYVYQVSATNNAGAGAAFTVPTLTIPALPGVPRTLTTPLVLWTQVTIQWQAPRTGGVPTGYVIERSTDANAISWPQIATVIAPATTTTPITYTDNSVVAGASYYYRVSATNAAGSGIALRGARVSVPLLPPAPTNFTVNRGAKGSNLLTITWRYTNGAQTGFTLERCPTNCANVNATWTPITTPPTTAVVSTTVTQYTVVDTGLTPGTTYFYRVKANYLTIPPPPWTTASAQAR